MVEIIYQLKNLMNKIGFLSKKKLLKKLIISLNKNKNYLPMNNKIKNKIKLKIQKLYN
jgi:hypothetical protein